MTSRKSSGKRDKQTSSQEDSHASPIASPENGKAKRMSGIYGESASEPFAWFDPGTHCLKTSQDSLPLMADASFGEFSETLPRSGMMRSGVLYRLHRSGLPTYEKGSGLWRTPAAQESGINPEDLTCADGSPPKPGERLYDKRGRNAQFGLAQQVVLWHTPTRGDVHPTYEKRYPGGKERPSPIPNLAAEVSEGKPYLFPTPTKQDFKRRGPNSKQQGLPEKVAKLCKTPSASDAFTGNLKKQEQIFGNSGSLAQEVESGFLERERLWPTPRTSDKQGAASKRVENAKSGEGEYQLREAVGGGQLSPIWVCWLMGYPLDWTWPDTPSLSEWLREYLNEPTNSRD